MRTVLKNKLIMYIYFIDQIEIQIIKTIFANGKSSIWNWLMFTKVLHPLIYSKIIINVFILF